MRRVRFLFLLFLLGTFIDGFQFARAQFGFNVTRVGGYTIGQVVQYLVIQGDYVYCADRFGLSVWDLTDPNRPEMVARKPTPGRAMGVTLYRNYAYVGDYLRGLAVFDITDPLHPRLVEYLELNITPGLYIASFSMKIEESILYMSNSDKLWIISLEHPDNPEVLSISDPPFEITDIVINDQVAYLSTGQPGVSLLVINIENPEEPELLNTIDGPDRGAIELKDSTLFAVGVVIGDRRSFASYSLENPAEPELIGEHQIAADNILLISGNYAFTSGDRESPLLVIDISDPRSPDVIWQGYSPPIRDLAIRDNFLFAACGFRGIVAISVADPANPIITNNDDLLTYHEMTALDVEGDYAYIQDQVQGLIIVDLSDKRDPQLVSEIGAHDGIAPGHIMVKKIGDVVYMADLTRYRGISIYDISNVAQPEFIRELIIGSCSPEFETSLYPYEGFLYIAGYLVCHDDEDILRKTLCVLDIEDPSDPEIVGWRNDITRTYEYSSLDNEILYQVGVDVAGGYTNVLVYSLAEPGNPELLGRWRSGTYQAILVHNNYAYVSKFNDIEIDVYSVENPVQPRHVGSLEIGFPVLGMCRDDNIIYLKLYYGLYGFACMSIEDPENPELVGWYDTPGELWGFKGENGYLYAADEYELGIYDCAELHGIWDLQVSEESHDFGEGLIDSNAVWELTLTNEARQAVDILSATVDSLAFSVEFDDILTLEPDDEASFQVTFTPTEARDYSSALIIHTERRDVLVTLSGTGIPLSAPEESNIPREFALYAAYPNPFNSRTTICYALPSASEVKLEVYDICGRRVENLFDGVAAAGRHTADWEAEDMPAGLYICRLSAGGQERSIKLLLVK